MTREAHAELGWWLDRIDTVNGRPIIEDAFTGVFDGTITLDASEDGFRG